MTRERNLAVGLMASLVLALAGCEQQESIEQYTVAKPVPFVPAAAKNPHAGLGPDAARPGADAGADAPAGEPTHRMLAAIVPHQDEGWFFRLLGPKDAVATRGDEFRALVKSVHFTADNKPAWTLPADWQERPGTQIRYATLVIAGADPPLEVSVTRLPKSVPDEKYSLDNINRWRGQMKLPPIGAEQLASESTHLPLAEGQATLVDLVGAAPANTMGGAPFMPGARDGNR